MMSSKKTPVLRRSHSLRQAVIMILALNTEGHSDAQDFSNQQAARRESISRTLCPVASISPKLAALVGAEGEKVIQETICSYAGFFGCSHPGIQVGLEDFSGETVSLPGGLILKTLEVAQPGRIDFDGNELNANLTSPKVLSHHLRKVLLHAMTHACQSFRPTPLEPFQLQDGARVSAVHGFSLLVSLPDGKETLYGFIEESVAEALAVTLSREIGFKFTTGEKGLFYGSVLTLRIMQEFSMDPVSVAKMVQKNDLMSFIGAVFNVPSPSHAQVERLMSFYEVVKKGADQQDVLNQLKRLRESGH